MKKILIAAAGTGGHLFPAEKLAGELALKGHKILFAGHGLEKGFYQKEFSFYEVSSAPLNKGGGIRFLRRTLKGLYQALKLILREKPDLVIGFGSYHVFPVLLAAKILKKKILLHEANTKLGKVNRFFSRFCEKIAVQFPVPHKRAILIHPGISLIKEKKTKESKEITLLIFGGSQGALFINQLMMRVTKELTRKRALSLIHIIGKNSSEEEIARFYEKHTISAEVITFSKEMGALYDQADLVIARSGAATVQELIYFEKPALLIPYPNSSEGHQVENGRFFTEVVGGGALLEQHTVTDALVQKEVEDLLSRREYHKEKIQKFKRQDLKSHRISLLEVVESI